MTNARVERGARRLVRLYPRGWRERFGDEFEQLLIDEMHDQPHSCTRTADVVAHAVLSHLSAAGLRGCELSPRTQAWRSLRILGVVAALFLALAIGLWSQVSVGSSWVAPAARDTRVAMAVMSGALLGLSAVGVLGAALVVAAFARSARRNPSRCLIAPAVSLACAVALWIGCAHVAARWPGAGASGWVRHSVVPAGLARLGWAGTLWISAYWVHPGVLVSRPGGVFAWMIACPLLLVLATTSGLLAARNVEVSARTLRALALLGVAGVVLAGVFVAGAAAWIIDSGPGPRQMFQPGSVDDVGLVLLTCALLAASHITRRSLVLGRRSPSR